MYSWKVPGSSIDRRSPLMATSYTTNPAFHLNLMARILASYTVNRVHPIILRAEELASWNGTRTEVP